MPRWPRTTLYEASRSVYRSLIVPNLLYCRSALHVSSADFCFTGMQARQSVNLSLIVSAAVIPSHPLDKSSLAIQWSIVP